MGGGGGLNASYWYQIFAVDAVVVKTQTMFSWHVRLPKYCNVSLQRNNVINLTHYDEKKAHNSQIVRAKEKLKFSHGGSIRHRTTDQSFKSGQSLSLRPSSAS